MDELPLAILSDILSRVSGESLLRYRCVCKRWREVIDDSYFRNSVHRPQEPVLLCEERKHGKIYLLMEHEEVPTKTVQIAKFPMLKDYALQGHCHGLLFYVPMEDVEDNPELLINPLTKEILTLSRAPDLSPHKSVYGLGFDYSTNTYKMVQISVIDYDKKTRTMGARVYDFEKRSWRTCKAPPLSHGAFPAFPDYGFVFASGALNWYLDGYSSSEGMFKRAVLSFDLTHEEFSSMSLPDVPPRNDLQMRELEGSLALLLHLKKAHIEVWVLKDDTRREWIRKYTIRPPCPHGFYMVVGSYKRDKLILHLWRDPRYKHEGLGEGEFVTYDVNENRIAGSDTKPDTAPTYQWRHSCCTSLSLVSLKPHRN
ncbi:hypothetical protein BT93_K1562 [Corymbia citriodora subsp. variegata]|nr:hypothetical protein BT93_K1562 [Corymbia citriodora subsp. variegata]